MEYILIAIVTLLVAGLTLFSGFGLGTLLMPVFALFFPIDVSIALTAIVHFANNLIKFGFFYRFVDWKIIVRFGLPSIVTAFAGAYLLSALSGLGPLFSYSVFEKSFDVTPIKLTISILLALFSLFDLIPRLSGLQFHKKYLPLGGILSGFFGGLSGHQGALRSAFLIRAGLSKDIFIGTGVVIACLIDISRLAVYSGNIIHHIGHSKSILLLVAVVSAFTGVYFGNLLVKKITIKTLQFIVAVVLLVFSALLGLGLV